MIIPQFLHYWLKHGPFPVVAHNTLKRFEGLLYFFEEVSVITMAAISLLSLQ
jgi:hypothetical protein